MKLPNAHSAIVDESKTREYLLNTTHRFGVSKARFFGEFGFSLDRWYEFAIALKDHAAHNEVVRVKETGFGPRYEVDGELPAPDGRRPRIRTVWQSDHNQGAPRLITAYPLESTP